MEVIQPQTPLQPKEISEVHVRNPNYKGKNYDPNVQAKCTEAAHTASHNNKQPQQASTVANQYKPAYNKPASTYNNSNSNAPLTSFSDKVGEVTLKTSVDRYQLLKVNEMIKNAVTWRARMSKTSKFSKYFDNSSKEGTPGTPEPKVHINEATLKSYGPSCQGLRVHRTGVCQGCENVPVLWQSKPGGCPHPHHTRLTTKAIQT